MQIRFITKTHTESLRPGNYSLLIAKCTYSDQSAYPHQVESRLTEILGTKSVAKFTVLLATSKNRGFSFLRDSMIWSWKGHVINAVLKYKHKGDAADPNEFFDLSDIERIMYLRFFLETEGALLLKMAQRFERDGRLTYAYLKAEILNIFNEILEGYIDSAPDLRSRLRFKETYQEMRKQLKNRKEGYHPGTLAHKVKPHIQAMRDLRLLDISDGPEGEVYTPVFYGGVSCLSVLEEQVQDFAKLEEIISTDNYYSLIAQILHLNATQYSQGTHREPLRQTLLWGYDLMRNRVSGMADIDALAHWARMWLLAEQNVVASRKDVEQLFEEMRRSDPSKLQYQLDGKGNIAYLILERK